MTYRDAFQAKPDLSAQFLRANAGAYSGVWIAPSIPATKLNAALALVSGAQNELPLALIDCDQTPSSKPALLVTARAVYVMDQSARIPIEAIVQIPSFPGGTAAAGVLDTSLGSVPIGVHAPAARGALYAVLRAIALFNRGASRWKYSPAPASGVVGELAQKFLTHEAISLAPMLADEWIHTSSSVFGRWLEYDGGESLIAYFDIGGGGSQFIALTDRRMLFLIFGEAASIGYDTLENVDHDKGFRSQTLTLHTARGKHKFATTLSADVVAHLTNFLLQICLLPAESRSAKRVAAEATADDPSGAQAALHSFAHPDLRAATLLLLIDSAVAQGSVPLDSALELVHRVMMLQNALRSGHGSNNGCYRTGLSASDLIAVMVQVLGAPVAQRMSGHNQWQLEFVLHNGPAPESGTTQASTVLGIALLAVAGFALIPTDNTASTSFQLWVAELAGGAAFSLIGVGTGPLGLYAPQLAGQLLDIIAQNTSAFLLRRILFGWNHSSEAMLQVPLMTIESRARDLVPGIDLAPFVL